MGRCRKKWHYMGDMDPKQGGHWVNLANWHWGYGDAVTTTPSTVCEGDPDLVLVEAHTVNLPDTLAELNQALAFSGMKIEVPDNHPLYSKPVNALAKGDLASVEIICTHNGDVVARGPDEVPFRHCILHSCLIYGLRDTERAELVRLDKSAPGNWGNIPVKVTLRPNASFDRWVQNEFLRRHV